LLSATVLAAALYYGAPVHYVAGFMILALILGGYCCSLENQKRGKN